MKRFQHFRPVAPVEERIQRSLEREFPSGEWVETESERTGTPVPVGSALPGEGLQVDDGPQAYGEFDSRALPTYIGGSSPAEGGSLGLDSPPTLTPDGREVVTIIGGTKYDEDALVLYLHNSPDTRVVCGSGRGVEASLEPDVRIDLSPDLFGPKARSVNVEQTLAFAPYSTVLLVGSGERVKQAKSFLNRARWPREVVELD